jgi:hypothetical protein
MKRETAFQIVVIGIAIITIISGVALLNQVLP